MRGYWRRPADTAAALVDGWLATGDIVRATDDGFLEIVGRKKEMIDVAGRKVYPREVEDVLYTHADVVEAAVIGVPDALRGEAVKAFVVLKPGSELDRRAVIAHCRTSLASYKVPRLVEFRDQLPRSTVGKLLKRALVEEERTRPHTSGSAAEAGEGSRP
jgi:long-chain acyl-CoA synthetase